VHDPHPRVADDGRRLFEHRPVQDEALDARIARPRLDDCR
jgi:hypothetical protein